MHAPLSQRLEEVLDAGAAAERLTANLLLERTEGRGLFLLMVLLSLPFAAWISPPGLSTVFGSITLILALQLAWDRPACLPRSIGNRPLHPKLLKIIRGSGLRVLRWFERFVRPRRTGWMTWRAVRVANALLVAWNAFLLALPLPAPPFYGSNAVPSYGVILLALAMMEEDGVFIWFAYAASLGVLVYFALWTELILHYAPKWFEALRTLLASLG